MCLQLQRNKKGKTRLFFSVFFLKLVGLRHSFRRLCRQEKKRPGKLKHRVSYHRIFCFST